MHQQLHKTDWGGEQLASTGVRVPHSSEAQRRISKSRFQQKIKRKGKKYNPLRWNDDQQPKKNSSVKLRGRPKGVEFIYLPETLSTESPDATYALIETISKIRDAVFVRRFKRVILDHSSVKSISPDAALVLLAEIQRCRAYIDGRSVLTGTYPREPSVSELLSEIGFFEALGIKEPNLPRGYLSRSYLRVEKSNKTLPEVAGKLLDKFSEGFEFGLQNNRALQVALVECMDNVFEHAYSLKSKDPYLFRQWWMVGYYDREDGSISFAFYDQGAGIANTVKLRKSRNLGERAQKIISWSDAKWLERAITRPMSRHESRRRGHGLNKLKAFIDNLGFDGRLRVVANSGSVEFAAGGDKYAESFAEPLNGSLIVWTLRPMGTTGPDK